MNLPNRLTLTRIALAPVFFVSFNLPSWLGVRPTPFSAVVVLAVYLATELTDLLDGMVARRHHLVTDLGKVMDPFADTVSRLTYFVCFVGAGLMPSAAFIVILWRELSILFVRMLMMGKGKPVPANIWGKSKAVLYAATGLCGIALHTLGSLAPDAGCLGTLGVLMDVLCVLAATASVASFLTYVHFIVKGGHLKGMTR